uniref:Nucleoid-associated protein NdpA n=1 Tax=Heterorhabditis bacteriophora TaxID=37862 RepID=A0A1I7XLM8_HETBA
MPRLRESGLLFSGIVVQIYITFLHLNEVTSDEFHYTLLPAAQKNKNNPRKFALALEKELYSNDRSEYNLNIDDRKVTMDKETFIQEVLIFVYQKGKQ